MRRSLLRLTTPVCAILAAVVTGACSDLTGVDRLNGRQPTTRDTVLPTMSIDTAGLSALKQGDSVRVIAKDDKGVRQLRLLFVRGDTTVIWRSAQVAGDGKDSLQTAVPIVDLGSTFPYGEDLRLVGLVEDINGKRRYTGNTGADTMNLAKATGATVRVGAGNVIVLPTGKFDDLSYDRTNRRLFFVATDAATAGSVDLQTFRRTSARMEPGSRPNRVLYRPRGWAGAPDVVIFDGGGRRLRVFPLDVASQGATRPLLSMELGQICLDTLPDPPDALALSRCVDTPTPNFFALPDTGVGRLQEICGPLGCETWLGRTARRGEPVGFWQRIRLTVADARFPFEVVTPLHTLPLGGASNVLAARDRMIPLRASPIDMRTGDIQTIWERNQLSTCGTMMDSSYVFAHGTLASGTSVVYVRPVSSSSCDFSVVRLNGTATAGPTGMGGWEIDRPTQVQVVGDKRWDEGPNRLTLTGDGRQVVAEYDDRLYVATNELDILADIRTGDITAGGLLTSPVGDIQANRWYVVADGRDLTVWDLETYQKVGTLRAAADMAGDLYIFPTGTAGELAIVGRSADRTSLVKVTATVRQIRGR